MLRRRFLGRLGVGLSVATWCFAGSVPVAFAKRRPRVVVYMTAWCRACQEHMRGLDRRSIPYRAVDIEKDPAPYEPVRKKLGRSTIPVTIIKRGSEQQWIIGSNSAGVERAYDAMSE